MPKYICVDKTEGYQAAAILFSEYAAWLNIDLGFQRFEEELASLKEMYAAPWGGIILCKNDSEYVGCIAVRKTDEDIAELKRMYVKPAHQKFGIGQALLHEALTMAKKYHYKKIRLDTLSNMLPAINLYKRNGFYEIPAYYFNPQSTAVFFEKILQE
ncbi:MAG: GNAT family N-acetyltransferase [Ferruginibacter sp.]